MPCTEAYKDMIQWTCHIKALSITEKSLTMSKKRKDNKGRILRVKKPICRETKENQVENTPLTTPFAYKFA